MKKNLFDIRGKVAMVTGARRGLGLAMATGLVEAGAKLVAVASSPDCRDLRRAVRKLGGEMLYLGSYRARRAGSMVVEARQAAPGGSSEAKPLFDVKCAFQVKMQSLENKDTSGDLEAMRNLAVQTGGRYFDYRNMGGLDELIAAIPSDPQVLSQEMLLEVWDGKVFLLLFLVLIGAEWSLRKLWGLL